jgi:ribosome-binding protein aMBF1 (putative translation factor)
MPRYYPLNADLAASIRRRRRSLGMSMNELALGSGLSEAAVQRYETLRYPIPPHCQAAIEDALAQAERKAAAERTGEVPA